MLELHLTFPPDQLFYFSYFLNSNNLERLSRPFHHGDNVTLMAWLNVPVITHLLDKGVNSIDQVKECYENFAHIFNMAECDLKIYTGKTVMRWLKSYLDYFSTYKKAYKYDQDIDQIIQDLESLIAKVIVT